MSRQERSLTKHIQEHENRLEKKRVAKQKERPPKPPRVHIDPERWDELDDDPPPDRALKPAPTRAAAIETLTEGQVIWAGARTCKVLTGDRIELCRSDLEVCVGDRASYNEQRRIRAVRPRTSVLSRPDPGNPNVEKLIAANIELVVIVVSVRSPALRPALIDRYLIAIEKGGASPLLCVNKSDLIESEADTAPLHPYLRLGFPSLYCSTHTGDGIEAMREALAGRLCVLVGHSGVGKSSLLNALAPDIGAATGAISAAHQKGRHTTTGSTLYRLANGARIIDTPGIREFGLWDLRPGELSRYFHEFDAFANSCAYGDCSHTHEPGCAVRSAVEAGSIPLARYETYRRLLEDAESC